MRVRRSRILNLQTGTSHSSWQRKEWPVFFRALLCTVACPHAWALVPSPNCLLQTGTTTIPILQVRKLRPDGTRTQTQVMGPASSRSWTHPLPLVPSPFQTQRSYQQSLSGREHASNCCTNPLVLDGGGEGTGLPGDIWQGLQTFLTGASGRKTLEARDGAKHTSYNAQGSPLWDENFLARVVNSAEVERHGLSHPMTSIPTTSLWQRDAHSQCRHPSVENLA